MLKVSPFRGHPKGFKHVPTRLLRSLIYLSPSVSGGGASHVRSGLPQRFHVGVEGSFSRQHDILSFLRNRASLVLRFCASELQRICPVHLGSWGFWVAEVGMRGSRKLREVVCPAAKAEIRRARRMHRWSNTWERQKPRQGWSLLQSPVSADILFGGCTLSHASSYW